jgi:Na+/H+ antiporter NhaD/arsenite permease-like protein
VLVYRGRWSLPPKAAGAISPRNGAIALDRFETLKALAVTIAVILAFIVSDWPRELIALGGAGLLLVNRQVSSTDMLKNVDGNLLLLVMGLFIVNAALAATGLPGQALAALHGAGLDLNHPLTLFLVTSGLSNIVGNNPTVMLLVPFLQQGLERDALGAALALGTGFSSNFVVFGSLAGIIVVEQAAAHGTTISFKEFSRAGIPVAIACMALAAGWIWMLAS